MTSTCDCKAPTPASAGDWCVVCGQWLTTAAGRPAPVIPSGPFLQDRCPRCGGEHDRIDRREPCPAPLAVCPECGKRIPADVLIPERCPGCGVFWASVLRLVELGIEGDIMIRERDQAERASMTPDQWESYLRWGEQQERDAAACAKAQFMDDPITVAYGVGGEMVGLITCRPDCPVCGEEA